MVRIMKNIPMVLLLTTILLVAWHGRLASALDGTSAQVLRGDGQWKTSARGATAARGWDVQLRRAGNELAGQIVLDDSPLGRVGTERARIHSSRVEGSIRGEDGRHLARLWGRVSGDTMSGGYRDRTGETGTWSWSGPIE